MSTNPLDFTGQPPVSTPAPAVQAPPIHVHFGQGPQQPPAQRGKPFALAAGGTVLAGGLAYAAFVHYFAPEPKVVEKPLPAPPPVIIREPAPPPIIREVPTIEVKTVYVEVPVKEPEKPKVELKTEPPPPPPPEPTPWNGSWRMSGRALPQITLHQYGTTLSGRYYPVNFTGGYAFTGGRVVGKDAEFAVTDTIGQRIHLGLRLLTEDTVRVESWRTAEDVLADLNRAGGGGRRGPQQAAAVKRALEQELRDAGKRRLVGNFKLVPDPSRIDHK